MAAIHQMSGLHHASSAYTVEGKSEGFRVRLLFLNNPNGEIKTFWRLYDYIKEKSRKSPSWQHQVVRSVGLFWDYYVQTNHLHYAKKKRERHRSLIFGYLDALLTGTYNSDGTDQTGLYWAKVSFKTVKRYARHIDDFIKWNHQMGDYDNFQESSVFNEITSNQMLLALEVARKRGITLLGHLSNSSNVDKKPSYIYESDPLGHHIQAAKYFPPKFFEKLLFDGYKLKGKISSIYGPIDRYNIRNMMICLLQGPGGCRESEPFHIFTTDVMEDPNKPGHAKVLLYHPSDSIINTKNKLTGKKVRQKRSDFLKEQFGLIPRHWQHSGIYRAGWKNLKLNKNAYAEIFWIDNAASALFWVLYKMYMINIRRSIMTKRFMLGGQEHPFLFVSEKGKPGVKGEKGFPGNPYTISQYEKAHKNAVLKIGLPYAKNHGTTPHGLRHLYGHLMIKMGVDPKIIQEGLHHRHFLSQGIYTVPDTKTINQELEKAREIIKKGDSMKILDESCTKQWIESQFNFN